MVSGPRLIEKLLSVDTEPEREEVQLEDDTHAYTCAVGKGCYIEHYLDRYWIVKPFLYLYEGQKLMIVNEFDCYDDQDSQY